MDLSKGAAVALGASLLATTTFSALLLVRVLSLERERDALGGLYSRVCAEADSLERQSNLWRFCADAMRSDRYYLVIDREGRRFQLRKRDALIREGPCAIGRGDRTLRGQNMEWETPAGERQVWDVRMNPHWRRPDWFWWERGIEVPDTFLVVPDGLSPSEEKAWYRELPQDQKLLVRSVPGYLGQYKIDLGEGIMIHYGGGLGGAASHGCIRVGWDDLDVLASVLKYGDKVFIY